MALLNNQLLHLCRSQQQLDIRMPPDHATGTAGCIEQDAVERFPVPPGVRVGAVCEKQAGL